MSVSSVINYVKENPFFSAGCVASVVSNPILFTVSACAGIIAVVLKSKTELVRCNPSSDCDFSNTTVFYSYKIERFKDYKNFAVNSVGLFLANKIQSLRCYNLIKMGSMLSSCFNGFLLGAEVVYLTS